MLNIIYFMTKLTALKLSLPPESNNRQRKRKYKTLEVCCRLVLMLVFVSCQTFSALPKSASEAEVNEMIRDRQKKQELSSEELKEKAEEQRKARNAEIKEKLSKPPTDFEHYTSPPSRKVAKSDTSQTTSSSNAQSTQTSAAQSPWTSLALPLILSIIVGVTVFIIIMLLFRKRHQNSTDHK